MATRTKQTIKTVWELRTYDVLGDAEDGYEVNDSSAYDRAYEIELEVNEFNPGTPHAFLAASPSDAQIREAFGIDAATAIVTDGDDTNIYVNFDESGYPVGEMYCTSHESLSPIRKKGAHEHKWGPVELSRFGGNPHRKCLECREITLDLTDDDSDDE